MKNSALAQNHWFYQRLEEVYAAARENEEKIKRFQSYELRLMASTSLADFLCVLLTGYKEFFQWDVTTLTLVDSINELRPLVARLVSRPGMHNGLKFLDSSAALQSIYGHRSVPQISAYDCSRHAVLFNALPAVRSVALLPLMSNGRLIGSFNIGCNGRRQLSGDQGTDFLQHLAAVIAVCLQTGVAQEKLRHLGLTDALTGVHNRRFFEHRLPEEIARTRRGHGPLSCMFIDLDHFKSINDNYGHQVGDKVLRLTAQVIQNQLRATDVVARYGGEEFAVLLSQTDNCQACEIAERIRRLVHEQTIEFDAFTTLSVSVSIGVASLSDVGRQTSSAAAGSQLVASADKAVYKAKAAGRNKVINGNREDFDSGVDQTYNRCTDLQHS